MTEEQKENAELALLLGRIHGSLMTLPQYIPKECDKAHQSLKELLRYITKSIARIFYEKEKTK